MNDSTNNAAKKIAEKADLSRSELRKKNRLENKGTRKSSSSSEPSVSLFSRTVNFFTESLEELKRVVWPTKKETIDSTWRLLLLVSIVGLYLWLIDGVWSGLLSLILG